MPRSVILDPVGERGAVEKPLAERFTDLNGKTMGLLANMKPSAVPILDAVATFLEQRYKLAGTIRRYRRDVHTSTLAGQAKKIGVPDQDVMDLAERADFVIGAIGD